MREIVHLQVGQCGNQLGVNFWEMICDEHAIDVEGQFRGFSPLQLDKLNVFFSCSSDGRYIPRAILIDSECAVLASIRNTDAGLLFRPDNFIHGKAGAANNFARGYYANGELLIERTMEVVRKECESADCIQGFQLVHSLGGGTGSGLGALIISRLREEYPDKLIITHSVIPTPRVSNVVVEPYNTLLALNHMIEMTDESCLYDNEALANICVDRLKLKNPTFGDLNRLISLAMSGVTTCLRFPGQLNADLRKLAVNMVPFPRLHFFTSSFAPLIPKNMRYYQLPVDVRQLTEEAFDVRNTMVDCGNRTDDGGKYLCVATIFRGGVSMKEVESNVADLNKKYRNDFVNWIPNNFNAAVCDISHTEIPVSVTFVSNNTCIRHVLARATTGSGIMQEKKAFLHWYTAEGLQETELDEARENVDKLIEEYLHYERKSSRNDNHRNDDFSDSPTENLESTSESVVNDNREKTARNGSPYHHHEERNVKPISDRIDESGKPDVTDKSRKRPSCKFRGKESSSSKDEKTRREAEENHPDRPKENLPKRNTDDVIHRRYTNIVQEEVTGPRKQLETEHDKNKGNADHSDAPKDGHRRQSDRELGAIEDNVSTYQSEEVQADWSTDDETANGNSN